MNQKYGFMKAPAALERGAISRALEGLCSLLFSLKHIAHTSLLHILSSSAQLFCSALCAKAVQPFLG